MYCVDVVYMHLMITKAKTKEGVREYAKIAESYRDKDGKVRKRVLQNLGPIRSEDDRKRFEQMVEEYKKGERFVRLNEIELEEVKEYGVTHTVEALLRKFGIDDPIRREVTENGAEFEVWDLLRAMLIKQVQEPSSERKTYKWIEEDYVRKLDVGLHHLFRALDYLIAGKPKIERGIFEKLKETLPIEEWTAYCDLTSTYFEGDACDLALFGYSRDHRSDRPQVVLTLVLMDGIPIMHEVFPGNTLDKTTLTDIVDALEERLGVSGAVFVADRGLMSEDNIKYCESAGFPYILGMPRRNNKTSEELLVKEIEADESPVAQEVRREEVKNAVRRYILCIDPETRKTRLNELDELMGDMEEKLEGVRKSYERSEKGRRGRPLTKDGAVKKAEKILGKNKRLFRVRMDGTLRWELKKEAWKYERTIAGKFLLVTTSELSPKEAMKKYKGLGSVERAFDKIKNSLDVRPIFHYKSRRVRGHILLDVLAFLIHSLIEHLTEESSDMIIGELKRIRMGSLEAPSASRRTLTALTSRQKKIFKMLDIACPSEFDLM